MPLKKGGDEAVAANIRELEHANDKKPPGQRRSHKQIVAIAHRAAGVSRGRRRK